MFDVNTILEDAVARDASDIHLAVGSPPAFRIDGIIQFIGDSTLTPEDTESLVDQILKPEQREQFERRHDFDLAISVPGLGRFRTNVLRQRGSAPGAGTDHGHDRQR